MYPTHRFQAMDISVYPEFQNPNQPPSLKRIINYIGDSNTPILSQIKPKTS